MIPTTTHPADVVEDPGHDMEVVAAEEAVEEEEVTLPSPQQLKQTLHRNINQ